MAAISSKRVRGLPPYLFIEIDRAKKRARAEGRDVIDLGIGDPDLPTPAFIVDSMREAVMDPSTHRYPLDSGLSSLRTAISGWYKRRFGIDLDPEREVLPLIGSKEGIAHAPIAFMDPGDTALVPDPCYPPYRNATALAGCGLETMPLLDGNAFLPDIDGIAGGTAKRARVLFINYPNNPTSACAPGGFFEKVVSFAERNDIMVLHDAAYTEIAFDGYRPPSFLQTERARALGIEFHSLSKTYNMTGWRIGFAVGNADMIAALAKVKSNIDSGIFTAVQRAGITALEKGDDCQREQLGVYQERRDVLCGGLEGIGMKFRRPAATFYVWMSAPRGLSSIDAASLLLEKGDIVATPGVGFGSGGEGYVRMAITVGTERLREAVDRIKRII